MTEFNRIYYMLMEKDAFGRDTSPSDFYDSWGLGQIGVNKQSFVSNRKDAKQTRDQQPVETCKCPNCGYEFECDEHVA